MEKNIDKMSLSANLSPEEFISLMFERTDEDGILYIPGWYSDVPENNEENDSYRCRVNWNLSDFERFFEKFRTIYGGIKKIAALYDNFDGDPENAKELLDKNTFEIWNTYIRPFDDNGFDRTLISDIIDRLKTIDCIKSISADLSKGEKLTEIDKRILREDMDTSVSEEELLLLEQYRNNLTKEAEKRIGKGMCAYSVIIGAIRTCRLMELGAPEFIIRKEGRVFAAAMVLHEYGVSMETVDNTVRLNIEKLETMTEDELDEYYHPKKSNSRKSMAPLFVYLILKEKSNSKIHLRQQDILNFLAKYPYEVSIERKALSRIIHNLIDSQLSVFSDQSGTWFEQE